MFIIFYNFQYIYIYIYLFFYTIIESSAKAFQQLFGISMIFDMLNHIDICSVSFRGLMKYIKKIGLTDEQLNNLNPEILDIYNCIIFFYKS